MLVTKGEQASGVEYGMANTDKRIKIFRGDRLREQRERMALSQDDMAETLGITQSQLWGYESNKTEPSPAHAGD